MPTLARLNTFDSINQMGCCSKQSRVSGNIIDTPYIDNEHALIQLKVCRQFREFQSLVSFLKFDSRAEVTDERRAAKMHFSRNKVKGQTISGGTYIQAAVATCAIIIAVYDTIFIVSSFLQVEFMSIIRLFRRYFSE